MPSGRSSSLAPGPARCALRRSRGSSWDRAALPMSSSVRPGVLHRLAHGDAVGVLLVQPLRVEVPDQRARSEEGGLVALAFLFGKAHDSVWRGPWLCSGTGFRGGGEPPRFTPRRRSVGLRPIRRHAFVAGRKLRDSGP